MLSRILHATTVTLIFAAGYLFGFELLYTVGATIFSGLLLYQQSIVKSDDLSKVNIAFMTANGIGSIVFAAFAISDLIFLS
jgi:4-hydroxybenzoate polyprenyltransferase